MTDTPIDPAIAALIRDVVHVGSAYDIDGMEKLYTPDQTFLVLGSDGHVTRVRRDDSIAEFRSRRDTGEEPLSTETGGLMLFVQYPGPTTGGRPIYDGRFNMKARKPVEEETVDV